MKEVRLEPSKAQKHILKITILFLLRTMPFAIQIERVMGCFKVSH
jgi:hypothetical protein